MRVQGFREVLGAFHLLDGPEIQRFSGILNPGLAAVRIIEAGEVRTVVEAVLGYINSRMVMRYKLPKEGAEIEVEVRVHWNEIDRMLKLSLPTSDPHATYYGQTAYGADNLPNDGSEAVAQKWTAILSKDRGIALTIVNNGVYGSDFSRGEARISLLRSPAYSGHPIENRPILPQDRYSPRMDQGERLYRFWIQGGRLDERLAAIDREALAHNETPVVLSFFPVGGGEPAGAFITLSDEVVLLSALKKAEDGAGLILRLFNPTAENRRTWVKIASLGINQEVHLSAFEIRSFRTADKSWVETDLMENAL
jgi:alpha-mannosidase